MRHPYGLYLGEVMKKSFTDFETFVPMISDEMPTMARELRLGFVVG
jgi:hypothetical protein